MVVDHANTILDWHSNLVREQVPPQWMWPFAEELKFWFEDVERARKERWGDDGGDRGDDADMIQNEEAVRLRRQWSKG